MAVSKKQQAAVNKYVKANYDRINYTIPKGKKGVIQDAAAESGESVNHYIDVAVDSRLEQRLRRQIKELGFELHKSRRRKPVSLEEREEYKDYVPSDMGGWQITDNTGAIIEGRNFELTITDVASWIKYISQNNYGK